MGTGRSRRLSQTKAGGAVQHRAAGCYHQRAGPGACVYSQQRPAEAGRVHCDVDSWVGLVGTVDVGQRRKKRPTPG
jgi:hypothetical protein